MCLCFVWDGLKMNQFELLSWKTTSHKDHLIEVCRPKSWSIWSYWDVVFHENYSIPDGHTKLYLPEYVIQYKYLFNTINQEMKIAEVSKLDKILN